jgi:hypothetical protein
MNLQPINPYQIIEYLKIENEALKAENEVLRMEVEGYVVMGTTDNRQDKE